MPPSSLKTLALLGIAAWSLPATGLAFHQNGAGACNGCHVMHERDDGEPSVVNGLLRFESATDVCLSCHATDHGSVFGVDPLFPSPERGGGNFIFLLEDNLNDAVDGRFDPIGGHHAGHNVVSMAWGIPVDPDHPVAPGGTYPSSQLGCTSCHDPHGNERFRMLYGANEEVSGGFVFAHAAPEGEGIQLTTEREGRASHTAYQSGWAEWCANCHGLYHDSFGTFEHPARHSLESDHAKSYNDYDGSSRPAEGIFATAYLPEVPIEDPAMTPTSTFGASGASQVMCLSCHRAHASSAPASGRWDFAVQFLQDDGAASGSYPLPSPYVNAAQRQLCLKCHYPDASDHGLGQPCLACHGGEGLVPIDPPPPPGN